MYRSLPESPQPARDGAGDDITAASPSGDTSPSVPRLQTAKTRYPVQCRARAYRYTYVVPGRPVEPSVPKPTAVKNNIGVFWHQIPGVDAESTSGFRRDWTVKPQSRQDGVTITEHGWTSTPSPEPRSRHTVNTTANTPSVLHGSGPGPARSVTPELEHRRGRLAVDERRQLGAFECAADATGRRRPWSSGDGSTRRRPTGCRKPRRRGCCSPSLGAVLGRPCRRHSQDAAVITRQRHGPRMG